METSAKAAAAAADANMMSFTPSLVRNLLQDFEQTCHDSSVQRLFQSSKTLRVDMTVADLFELGSAMTRNVLPLAAPDFDRAIAAFLPNLKPMIEECFSVAISQFISEVINKMCSQGPDTSFEVNNHDENLKSEMVFEDEEKFHPADDSPAEEVADGDCDTDQYYHTIPPSHDERTLRKDVPPHILYTRRGVRCKLCWRLFKCSNAVDVLVKHTKEVHPEKASASFLRLLRRNNAFNKVIGKGIPYCTCEYCKIFGTARFHNGYPKRTYYGCKQ